LHAYLDSHSPARAIDLGCGTGTNVAALVQHGWQVSGVDFVPRAIAQARRKLKAAGLSADLHVGDVTHLYGIQGPYQLALDIGCFHGLNDKKAYLRELNRILAPGGHWLLYGFFRTSLAGPGLAAPDLDSILAHGFTQLSRVDGFDKRDRPSAWFLYEKQSP
jgi:ubiquinone/menaquinone biosynthesis C-methylase UbiE